MVEKTITCFVNLTVIVVGLCFQQPKLQWQAVDILTYKLNNVVNLVGAWKRSLWEAGEGYRDNNI